MRLQWLVQQCADVPEHDEWLAPFERDVLAKLWAPKRRRDWRLGRWTARLALTRSGAVQPGDGRRLSIRADEAGVPRVFVDETECDWVVSISHTGEHGLAAVARKPAALGCDLETIGRRGEEFVVDWFTEGERALVSALGGDARSRRVTLVWSAKESALKALGLGLRLDTRSVEVALADGGAEADGWRALLVTAPATEFHGWWRVDEMRALTVLGDPAPDVPIALVP